ncbi:MAG TPA: cysteate synthase [Bacteroidales bacterium]|nr:MAG: cysteate synthase [Bacteroidetes bacterium GWE2_42_24]OFY28116.1 MAG: cysteate synthase [Bacteroidetes bacterium GWF2_43_11]HBZ65496.1 cysteate synthase [Bacteroidales bacterium]
MNDHDLHTTYRLQSVISGAIFDDQGWTLDAPGEQQPSLIRAIYNTKQIKVKEPEHGIYRFADWLPVHRKLQGSSAPVTYQSKGLAASLGLKNLWITFNGYWPEKEALMNTCSFKETEAYTVCARLPRNNNQVLVVASAGNTARAFAHVCSVNRIPLLLCVPEDNLNALWSDAPLDECVRLICTKTGSDYFDAIQLSNTAVMVGGFIAEGGAKNVARRDGMSTTVLSAVTTIGQIPEYYFQAVGSGTGAIAAWEANLRLLADGRFGQQTMKLMVSQNEPFLPIYDAWHAASRQMLCFNDDDARRQVEMIDAKVLSNRKPPYGITGGLFDALTQTKGTVLRASNQQGRAAQQRFLETEGIDIHPAAGIALASLVNELDAGHIRSDALIMLNITGGGEQRLKRENHLHPIKPSHIFNINPSKEEVETILTRLFKQN